jgi:MoaA/NifB/PqqE/SkfB family radical SAM enzyme
MVVNRTNYRSLKAFMEFFNGLGVSEFRFNVMRPEGRAMSNFSELGIRYSGLAPEIIDSIEYAKKRGIGLTVDCLPKCIADTSEIPDEFMGEPKDYFDRIVSFSNSKKKAFSWKEKIKNELKTKPKSCKKCVFDDSCDGVWRGYIERFGSGEFKPVRNVQSGDL